MAAVEVAVAATAAEASVAEAAQQAVEVSGALSVAEMAAAATTEAATAVQQAVIAALQAEPATRQRKRMRLHHKLRGLRPPRARETSEASPAIPIERIPRSRCCQSRCLAGGPDSESPPAVDLGSLARVS